MTQNIDGFTNMFKVPVIEVHGTHQTMICMKCGLVCGTNLDQIICKCGGYFRPNVVLFGEKLASDKVFYIYQLLKRHPMYTVIIGISLQFPYLRDFINQTKMKGSKIIHINPDDTYVSNIGYHEQWVHKNAADGIQELIDGCNRQIV